MCFSPVGSIELKAISNQEQKKKIGIEFYKNEKTSDFRIFYFFLSTILLSLVIFKIYANITQAHHVLGKFDKIYELFHNQECQEIEINYSIKVYLENFKILILKINFCNYLSIICLIYLSLHKKDQKSKFIEWLVTIIFYCSIILSIASEILTLRNFNIVLFAFSILFTSISWIVLHNRIRKSTFVFIGVLYSLYFSFCFIFIFLGATIQKIVMGDNFKSFSESFQSNTEIFYPVEKICKKYNFGIENIYFRDCNLISNSDESISIILYEDAFNSIITIESPKIINNTNLRQLLISLIATKVVKAFYKNVFYSFMTKFIVNFLQALLMSIFIAFFETMMTFNELIAVIFFLQYIFKEYFIEMAFNIIYKKIYTSVMDKMMMNPRESCYILDEMLRFITYDPIIYSNSRLFEFFSPYPSLSITCYKALEAIKKIN